MHQPLIDSPTSILDAIGCRWWCDVGGPEFVQAPLPLGTEAALPSMPECCAVSPRLVAPRVLSDLPDPRAPLDPGATSLCLRSMVAEF